MCHEIEDFPPPMPLQSAVRTYKLALATRVGYAIPDGQTWAGHIGDIVNTINVWFEREMAVRFEPVIDSRLRFRSADPVGLACGNAPVAHGKCPSGGTLAGFACVMRELRNQGLKDFDIGHLLGQSQSCPGGAAGIGVVCITDTYLQKARGVTMFPNPEYPRYRLLTHEIGHQLGAHHTYSAGSCGLISPYSSHEPGSGSTLMSYAGSCDDDDVRAGRAAYFNINSIEWMRMAMNENDEGCIQAMAPGIWNEAPLVASGGTFTIPPDTAFELIASATDLDGDGLTYSWEQYDHDCRPTSAMVDDPGSDPLFRSQEPRALSDQPGSAVRTFVDEGIPGGILPTIETTRPGEQPITMRLVVRDGQGGVSHQETRIEVSGTPFRVVAEPAREGVPTRFQWNHTDLPAGNRDGTVDILFSSDGEQFTPLIEGAANDGEEYIQLDAVCGADSNVIRVRATYGDIETGTSLVLFDDFEFQIFCNCPSLQQASCGSCHAARCSYLDTVEQACWNTDDWFVCPLGETVQLRTCLCLPRAQPTLPPGTPPRPQSVLVCPARSYSWECRAPRH